MIHSICVYCASSTKIDDKYFEAAHLLGQKMGQLGITLINGAGNLGLMQASTDGCLEAGGRAIGVAKPVSIYVNTYGRKHVDLTDGEIAQKIQELFDLRPYSIEQRLKLRNPIYEETAAYGHMGREPKVVTKTFESLYNDRRKIMTVELFTWEKLDYVDKIKEAFGL